MKTSHGKIVSTKAEMNEAKNGEKILGLFADSDIEYHQKQIDDIEKGVDASEVWKNTPTLKEMTEKAIESLLATSDDGFYSLELKSSFSFFGQKSCVETTLSTTLSKNFCF